MVHPVQVHHHFDLREVHPVILLALVVLAIRVPADGIFAAEISFRSRPLQFSAQQLFDHRVDARIRNQTSQLRPLLDDAVRAPFLVLEGRRVAGPFLLDGIGDRGDFVGGECLPEEEVAEGLEKTVSSNFSILF